MPSAFGTLALSVVPHTRDWHSGISVLAASRAIALEHLPVLRSRELVTLETEHDQTFVINLVVEDRLEALITSEAVGDVEGEFERLLTVEPVHWNDVQNRMGVPGGFKSFRHNGSKNSNAILPCIRHTISTIVRVGLDLHHYQRHELGRDKEAGAVKEPSYVGIGFNSVGPQVELQPPWFSLVLHAGSDKDGIQEGHSCPCSHLGSH